MEHKYYPLTHVQKSIWSSEQLFPGTSMSNVAGTMRILANVDFELLEQAVNLFIKENDAARLHITEIDGEPLQYVVDYQYKKLDFFDFAGNINDLFKWDEKQAKFPMTLLDTDLYYVALVRINDNDGGIFVRVHHLIADAWTMVLMGNQFIENYNDLKEGTYLADRTRPSFIDYISSEEKYFESKRFDNDRQYWSGKFANWQEATVIKSRKEKTGLTKARRKTQIIPQKLTQKIREYCQQNKVSEFSLFMAGFAMYINRVTGKEDLVLGSTFLNRVNAVERETVGMFANIAVPMRFNLRDDMDFNTFVEQVCKETLGALKHQKYPFDLILKEVREKNKTAVSLFDIVLTYQNSKFIKLSNSDQYITRWHFNGYQIESLIINLNDRESDGRLIVDYDYSTDLFYATEIDFIHQHIINVLWHALDNPQKKICNLEMLSEKEKQKILNRFNDTAADFPHDKTIQQLFAEQVEKTPDSTTIMFGEQSLTYRELNEKANALANILRGKGVRNDSVVALMLDRSVEMIIGIMGILKAGGAYLPVNPMYPEERIRYVLEDCGAGIMLINNEIKTASFYQLEVINLSDASLYTGDNSEPAYISSARDLAYIIYTSGSTGKPKGVMNEHRSLVNRLHWMQKKYPLDQDSVILQKTPFSFDVSVWEILWWSIVGAKVCLLEPGGEKDPRAIIEAIKKYRVTTMHFVPSMLAMFLKFLESYDHIDDLSSLQQVFSSGEALSLRQTEKFNQLLNNAFGTRLANLYGPTEAAIDVSSFDCSPRVELNTVPIGKPIDNIKLYILDKHLNMVPIGIAGELFIGGIGLARGYINNLQLTAEKFIPNPFDDNDRLYRTGDLARWYAEGDIEYLGRIDFQVKIRGFRIELGEVENKLLLHPEIKEAVVTGIEQDDKKYLCAYYIGNSEVSSRNLKHFLLNDLPEYMIPSYFVRVQSLPLSANGKLDKKMLPLPSGGDSEAVYAPPRNEIEKKLVAAFEEALFTNITEKRAVGIDDNLFDLGADSLLVLVIYSKIYGYNWGLTANDFYSYPTVRELAEKIQGQIEEKPADELVLSNVATVEWPEDSIDMLTTREINNVLLTGATGFLGVHILSELLESSQSVVYCLVRGENQQAAEARLIKMLSIYFGNKYLTYLGKRVICLNGDITLSKLGLTADRYEILGRSIDCIIHSAAMVKYFGDYTRIEQVNVKGTREVVDFALRYNIKLNHISTVSVTGDYLVDNAVDGEFTERNFYVGQDVYGNIYVRSKFEAENCLLKATEKGLRATIFRMGNLTGRYSDGFFQQNIADNAFYSAIGSVVNTGIISEGILAEQIELTPIDCAARAIVKIAATNEADGRIFHIFNNKMLSVGHLLEMFRSINIAIRPMNNTQIEKLLKQEFKSKNKRDPMQGMLVYLNDTGDLAHRATLDIKADFTVDYLAKAGFVWPQIDQVYLSKVLEYMRSVNFLPAAVGRIV